jgi:formylmethanofuran dehydrogenase subunit E
VHHHVGSSKIGPQTPTGCGDDSWRICAACGEEVLKGDERTRGGGYDFCPRCWADLNADPEWDADA